MLPIKIVNFLFSEWLTKIYIVPNAKKESFMRQLCSKIYTVSCFIFLLSLNPRASNTSKTSLTSNELGLGMILYMISNVNSDKIA